MSPAQPQPPGRTLVLLGDTVHHVDATGRLCTHAALASQLDLWARHFDRVVFCGVREEGPPPASFAPYASTNIQLVPLRAAGGTGWRAKLGAVIAAFSWVRTIVPVLRHADAVHLRAPCNVTLVCLPLSRLLVRNRYAIFAGSWEAYPGEALSYRLQRWMLRHGFGGVVHAYLAEAVDGSGIRPAFSPVLTDRELTEVVALRESHGGAGRPGVDRPLRVVSIGRFSPNKNQIALIETIRTLRAEGLAVEATLIGEGPTRSAVRQAAAGLDSVDFVAVADRREVFETMARADLNVLASFREGYPKVLLEGISAGALPVAADRPVNRSTTDGRGWVFDPARSDTLASVLRGAVGMSQAEWQARRSRGLDYARSHTLDAFGSEVDHIVHDIWGFNDDARSTSDQPPGS